MQLKHSYIKNNDDYLVEVDWSAARSLYKKLSDEFHVLTGAYKITVEPREKLMLDHLILCIDEVDASIDILPTKEARDTITQSILHYLQDDSDVWNCEAANQQLTDRIQMLKSIVVELNVVDRFHQAAHDIFHFTELKRHTESEEELLDFILKEGHATAELPLTIMQIDERDAFALFFNRLCMLMGIADLVIDARSDFQANFIVIKPRLFLYLKLFRILIVEGLKLVWYFPKKIPFLVYCLQFSFLLLTADD